MLCGTVKGINMNVKEIVFWGAWKNETEEVFSFYWGFWKIKGMSGKMNFYCELLIDEYIDFLVFIVFILNTKHQTRVSVPVLEQV